MINKFQIKSMISFLGLRVYQTISNRQKYNEALEEIRHYLSFKQGVTVEETDYLLTVLKGDYCLELVKHPAYLHTCHFNLPVLHP
jgi:ABC-type dipeptide/oligopeptide/nickel transport system permease component